MCDIADDWGRPIHEVKESLSPFELRVRIVNRMNRNGYTYDQEKIQEQERLKEQRAAEAVLARARKNNWR